VVHVADTVKVVDARLDNGILTVTLENRIPEEDKPILIPINSGGKKKVLLQE
jgi:HSP20 family molecular chaperone IbpA